MKCECCGQEIRQATSDKFNEFWSVYPSKVGKKKCAQKWKKRKLDALADIIISDVRDRVENDPRWQAGYVLNPETYINGDHWEDVIVVQPKEMKLPTTNDDWMALGAKYRINPGVGEGWPQYKARVKACIDS